jgi:hypothetical protein
VLATACSSNPSPDLGALKGKTAATVLSLSQAAVTATASSFHFADETRVGSHVTTLSGYDTNDGADQILGGAAPSLEVLRTAAGGIFVRGAATALQASLNLSAAVAAAHTNSWISLVPGDAPYVTVANTLDPGQELNSFIPAAPLHLEGPRKLHGRTVLAVVGTAAATAANGAGHVATLYVPTKAPYTPVGATLTFGSGSEHGTEVVVFKEWGKRVDPATPTAAVAYSTLTG